MLTSHVLAGGFAIIHARHPGLLIEAVADVPRDAAGAVEPEVAVQLRRFERHDLIVRNVGTIAFGLYGCVAYWRGTASRTSATAAPVTS